MRHPGSTSPPGAEQTTRRCPRVRYELVSCGLHGHVLLGTDVAHIRSEDAAVARQSGGLRWYRCLRCDAWLPMPPPTNPEHQFLPARGDVHLPLRGRPLRDRYVLRLIAAERTLHVLVLGSIAAAIFLFADDRSQLHGDFTRILAGMQGAFGGPIGSSHSGFVAEINRLFALSTTTLYLLGLAATAYTAVLAAEAVGLWLCRRWAEYLTFLETAVLVPFELYELTSSVTALKTVSLILNLVVVLYLLLSKRLFGLRGGGDAERRQAHYDNGWAALDRTSPVAAGDAVPTAPV